MAQQRVRISIPAQASYLRYARVAAATLADDLGFAVDAIEQLRVAVDELCALAMSDTADGAELTLDMYGERGAVVVEGVCQPVTEEPEIDPIAKELLAAMADEHSIKLDGDACHLRLRKDNPAGP